jgi:predicted phosphate transport protein (TIGR00153 family)
MRFRLMPPDRAFYDLFDEAAQNVAESARLLRDLLGDVDSSEVREALTVCERRGDELTACILARLRQTIVPPFDPEDIHRLAEHVDDVVDNMDKAGKLLLLHQVTEPLSELLELADLLVKSAEANVALFAKLPTLRNLGPELDAIDRLESEADRVYRRSVARLFSGEFQAFEVLKLKGIVEVIEVAVNSIEKVSDVIEAIAVKHA